MADGEAKEKSAPRVDDGVRMRALNSRLENLIARSRIDEDRTKRLQQAEIDNRKRMEDEKARAVAALQKELDVERDNVKKLSVAYNDVTHQLNVKNESVAQLKQDLADKERDNDSLRGQLEKATSDLTTEKTGQEATREAHAKVSRLLKDAQANNRKLEEKLASVRTERNTLHQEKTRLASIHGLSSEDLKKTREKWLADIEGLKKQVRGLTAKNEKLSGIFLEKFNAQLAEQVAAIEAQSREALDEEKRALKNFYEKRLEELKHRLEEGANLVQEKIEIINDLSDKATLANADRAKLERDLDEKTTALQEARQRYDRERRTLLLQLQTIKSAYTSLEKEYDELKKNKLEFVTAIGTTKALLDYEDRRLVDEKLNTDERDTKVTAEREGDDSLEVDLEKFADEEVRAIMLRAKQNGEAAVLRVTPSSVSVSSSSSSSVSSKVSKVENAPTSSIDIRPKGRKEGEQTPTKKRGRGRPPKNAAATGAGGAGRRATVASGSSSTTTASSSSNANAGRRRSARVATSKQVATSLEPGQSRKRKRTADPDAPAPPSSNSAPSRRNESAKAKAKEPSSSSSSSSSSDKKGAAQPSAFGNGSSSAAAETPKEAPKQKKAKVNGDVPHEERPSKRQRQAPAVGEAEALSVRYDASAHAIVAKNVSEAAFSLKEFTLCAGGKSVRLSKERVLKPGCECFFYGSLDDADKYGKGKPMKVALSQSNVSFSEAMASSIRLESPEGVMYMPAEDQEQKSGCVIM